MVIAEAIFVISLIAIGFGIICLLIAAFFNEVYDVFEGVGEIIILIGGRFLILGIILYSIL